jgi:hypothetical protein
MNHIIIFIVLVILIALYFNNDVTENMASIDTIRPESNCDRCSKNKFADTCMACPNCTIIKDIRSGVSVCGLKPTTPVITTPKPSVV